MVAHSIDRFYVVTKFILPTIGDLKFLTVNIKDKCEYLRKKEMSMTLKMNSVLQIL